MAEHRTELDVMKYDWGAEPENLSMLVGELIDQLDLVAYEVRDDYDNLLGYEFKKKTESTLEGVR